MRLTSTLAVLGLIGVSLSACAEFGFVPRGKTGAEAEMKLAISRSTINALPYASISFRPEGKAPYFAVLETVKINALPFVDEDKLSWVAADYTKISTTNGRLTATEGFIRNLNFIQALSKDPMAKTPEGGRYSQLVNLEEDGRRDFLVVCHSTPDIIETIKIKNVLHKTMHFIEKCEAEKIKWAFTNHFWRDVETGFTWRSIQHIGPKQGPITISVLKAPVL